MSQQPTLSLHVQMILTNKVFFLLSTLLATSSFVAYGGYPSHYYDHNDNQHNEIKLYPDDDWTVFTFKNDGEFTCKSFIFHNDHFMKLFLTDFMCAGDNFKVFDNDVLIGETKLVPIDVNCTYPLFSPQLGFESKDFSNAVFKMYPGHHNITIKAGVSPWDEGSAAVRLVHTPYDYEKECPYDGGEFRCISPRYFHNADDACHSIGMKLADVNSSNFDEATVAAFNCAGPFSSVWISSWDTDNYNNACLQLAVGASLPGGAVNEVPCDQMKGVLCQKKK